MTQTTFLRKKDNNADIDLDLKEDPDLAWVAKEALQAQLPSGWKPCENKANGDIYYFNFETGEVHANTHFS
eukprot:m.518523 g.518523  ORF g.518523 m.518523 type:complete len:71 (-) comp21940_c0_seq9:2489-2701(-)